VTSSFHAQPDLREEPFAYIRQIDGTTFKAEVEASCGALQAGWNAYTPRSRAPLLAAWRFAAGTSYQRRGGGRAGGGGITNSSIVRRIKRSTTARTSLRCGPQPSSPVASSAIVRGPSRSSPR